MLYLRIFGSVLAALYGLVLLAQCFDDEGAALKVSVRIARAAALLSLALRLWL